MFGSLRQGLLKGCTAVAIGATAVPAAADAADGLEDVVVTARRVQESLQAAPLAVSALSGDALAERSITAVTDLAGVVPNLTSTNGPQGSGDANFFIRGVGQFDFIITTDPGVGVYVDGVYLGRTVGALVDNADLARVEVLRGPQGTLFGRNSIGGVVSVVTRQPELGRFGAEAALTAGSRSRADETGALNLPLGDTLALRVSAQHRRQDGQSTRVTDGKTFGDIDRTTARAGLLFAPGEAFHATLSADYTRDTGSPSPEINAGAVAGFGPPGQPFVPVDINDDRPRRFYDTYQSNDRDNDVTVWGSSLTLEYKPGDTQSLKSITAYRHLRSATASDSDGTLYRLYDQSSATRQWQFSEELQWSGAVRDGAVDWVSGLYFFRESAAQVQELCIATAPVRLAPACGFWYQNNDQDTKSYAAFGELRLKVAGALRLTLGGRYTHETKRIGSVQDFDFFGAVLPIVPAPGVPGATGRGDDAFSKFTPKVGLDWQVREDLLAYASFSQGFRSGGFNGRLAVPGPIRTYQPDVNDSVEAGVKGTWLDKRLRANVAAFWSRYRDIQQTVTDPVVQFYVANAAQAKLYGLETEVRALLARTWSLEVSAGYTHAAFTAVDPALVPTRVVVGNRLPFSPRVTAAVGTDYTFDLGALGSLTPRVDWRYQSSQYFSPANQPQEYQGAYGLLSARLTWRSPGERYSASVFGTNLGDEKYYVFGQDARFNQGVSYLFPGRPREWGVTVGARF
jgi:iron complex outermembrane receptor protein